MDPIWSGNTLRSNTSWNFSPFFFFCLRLCVCVSFHCQHVNVEGWKAEFCNTVYAGELQQAAWHPSCPWVPLDNHHHLLPQTGDHHHLLSQTGGWWGFETCFIPKRWSLFRSRRWQPRCSMRPSRLFWPGNVRHRCWHPPLSPSVLRFDAGILMF